MVEFSILVFFPHLGKVLNSPLAKGDARNYALNKSFQRWQEQQK